MHDDTDCSPRNIAWLKGNQGTEQYALIYVKNKRTHTRIHMYIRVCAYISIYINVHTHVLVDSSAKIQKKLITMIASGD